MPTGWHAAHPAGFELTPRSVVPRAVRALIHAGLLALVVTWVVAPEHPGPLFASLGGGLAAISLALGLLAHARPRVERAVARVRRGLDLATLAFALSFGLAELELRLLARCVDSPLLAPPDARADEVIRAFRLKPGQRTRGTVVNADGFLGGEFARARRPGVKRIVALGDSFAVGVVALRDNFLTRLDQMLDHPGATPADDVEVYNCGVVSTSPREYLHLWRTEANRFDPDLVLLCFFAGNDWGVSRNASLLDADSTFLVTFARRFATLAGARRAAAKSERATATSVATDEGAVEALPTLTPEALARVERGSLELQRRAPTRATAQKFEETFALFETIVAEIGPRLRVAILPDQLQVDDAMFREIAGGEAEAFDREQPSRRLADWLEQHGVRHLDLLPALRAAQQGGATYRAGDTHWNERGNAAAADALAHWLAPDVR